MNPAAFFRAMEKKKLAMEAWAKYCTSLKFACLAHVLQFEAHSVGFI